MTGAVAAGVVWWMKIQQVLALQIAEGCLLVAVVLWFPVMQQICQAISFMALPPRHRAVMSRPG